MSRLTIVLGLMASLGTVSTAFAVDPTATDLQAQLGWRAAFGGTSRQVEAGYGLTVGYRAAEDSPLANVLQLDVSEAGALARVVGLPLYERSYRADEIDSDGPDAASTTEHQPWYSQSWVLWTLGGIAATAALANSGSSGTSGGNNDCSTNGGCGVNCTDGNCTVPANQNQGCVNGICVTCSNGDIVSQCDSLLPGAALRPRSTEDVERQDWLDAGSGGMGDLVAR